MRFIAIILALLCLSTPKANAAVKKTNRAINRFIRNVAFPTRNFVARNFVARNFVARNFQTQNYVARNFQYTIPLQLQYVAPVQVALPPAPDPVQVLTIPPENLTLAPKIMPPCDQASRVFIRLRH